MLKNKNLFLQKVNSNKYAKFINNKVLLNEIKLNDTKFNIVVIKEKQEFARSSFNRLSR